MGFECFTEILMSVKSSSSRIRISFIADSTSASGLGRPYFARRSFSSDPALTPIRMGTPRDLASRAISFTLSWYLMLPGLMRNPWMPASNAALAYFPWKWMSATTGTVACSAIAFRARASSQWGTATRTMSTPAATSEAICCSVVSTSAVLVVVIDWTRTGASPPTLTHPILIRRDFLRWMAIDFSLRAGHGQLPGGRRGPAAVTIRRDLQPHTVAELSELQCPRPFGPPDVPVPAPRILGGAPPGDLLHEEPPPLALGEDLLGRHARVQLDHREGVYSPKTWKTTCRSCGSSSSTNSSRCHLPSSGSPAATGIAWDVAERSICITCAWPFCRSCTSSRFCVRRSRSSWA